MRDLKNHFNNEFRSNDFSRWIGLLEVKEIRWIIDAISFTFILVFYFNFGYSYIMSLVFAGGIHLLLSSFFAFMGTIKDRKYRKNKKIKENLIQTLNRLSLNKARKVYARKTRF